MANFKLYPRHIWSWLEGNARTHPDEIRHAATSAIWARWTFAVGCVFLLVYRPANEVYSYTTLVLLLATFVSLNGWLHGRLVLQQAISWRWMLAVSAVEVALISAAIVVGGGFKHFVFVAYYPSLALIAVVSTSVALVVMWTTLVAFIYSLISFLAGSGIDLELREEKALFTRILAMYALAITVNLISRIERIQRREAIRRERFLFDERMKVSRTIHDTSAQAAYMISLGIESALDLAERSNRRLIATLEGTSELAKSAMWELRRPVNMGLIFEGSAIGSALRTHIATFTTITSVAAELVQTGQEPRLPADIRAVLFSVAHNALTNAFRHAGASKVTVALDFRPDCIRLAVSDDGVGLPADFEDRGRGFANMRSDAETMGGVLLVESSTMNGGTTVACEIPGSKAQRGG